MKYLINILFVLLSHYPIKTIWLNFKLLPFSQAIRLPIFLYSKTRFRDLSGKVTINSEKISPNMIKIGCQWYYPSTAVPLSVWSILGEIEFSGPISFAQGTYLLVAKNGRLHFGSRGAFVGTNTKIMCFNSIYLDDNVRITWDCQLYDTSFHYVEFDDNVLPLTKPIIIGSDTWIGNHTTITKGAILPKHSIVCSHSLVNKNFSNHGEYCMFAGVPANLKKEKIARIFDTEIEQQYDKLFNYSRNHL